MIPCEIADLCDLIAPGWSEMDDDASGEVIRAAYRIREAGYQSPKEIQEAINERLGDLRA